MEFSSGFKGLKIRLLLSKQSDGILTDNYRSSLPRRSLNLPTHTIPLIRLSRSAEERRREMTAEICQMKCFCTWQMRKPHRCPNSLRTYAVNITTHTCCVVSLATGSYPLPRTVLQKDLVRPLSVYCYFLFSLRSPVAAYIFFLYYRYFFLLSFLQ